MDGCVCVAGDGVLKKCYTYRDACMFAGGVRYFEWWNGGGNSAHLLRRNR